MATKKLLTRTVDGKTEDVLIMVWNGVRIMRGAPHPDGPQGSFEKLDLAGAAAEAEAKRRIASLRSEGFVEKKEDAAPPPKPRKAEKPRAPLAPSQARPVAAAPAWARTLTPPLDKQLAGLRRALAKAGLGHRAAELEALARPGIGLSVKKAKPADLKAIVSRIGGEPDLPPGAKWPALKGLPLSFVAQVVLADMKAHDLERVLPASGVLSFFAQLDSQKADYGELGLVLHSPSSPKLARTTAPPGVARIEKAGLLTPKVRLTLPPRDELAVERLGLNGDEASAYHDQVFLPSIPEGRVHLLAGWPSAATMHGIKGKRFVAQLDSDHHLDFEMGDYETLRFYVNGDTLDAAALKAAVATLSEA